VRLRLYESPAFQRVKDTGTEAPMPILDVLRKYPREVLLAMGMRVAENGTFYILTVYVLVYGNEELELPKSTMLWGVVIAALLGLVTIPCYGALSDRVGRRPLYLGGALFSLVFAFPFFLLLNTKTALLIWLAIVLGVNVGHDLMYGPQAAYFAELFGTRVRYSGASLGYQLASVFAGGFAPLVAAALLKWSGWTAVAAYMAVMAAITVVTTWLAPETYRGDIDADDQREQELVSRRRITPEARA
jgi:MFS transporter, MHS family, shikimate and dehydroshikimate transport protein